MPRFITTDGLSLHFTDTGGEGLPVICLSGLTRNGTDFDYAAPTLTGTRMITLDYRGRGQSDWATDFMTYNILREGQDAIELLDHLGIEKTAVLGTSRGGLIGMMLAATQPQRLSGLCLVDVGPVLDTSGLDVIMGYLGRNPVWKTHAEAAAMIGSRIAGFDNVPAERWQEEVEKHFIQTGDGLKINYDPKLRDAILASMTEFAPDLWPLFEAAKSMPLALIRGANSDLLSQETAQEMQTRAPDMVFADVPGRGHVPFLDEVESVAALTKWLGKMT
ncbi:alpha/beta fold hydrolase [Shimia biformata]|uniref:alpha/beta fold hydrolase n=1 Tax=Shimia biformata TaxID=1294299 RepID=UPI001950C290|nr:alpha/beta hydrolase [Shimia biformata]